MSYKTIHMSMSVRGALSMSKVELRRMAPSITIDGVRLQTADQVREFFMDELAKGHEVIPMTDCDNFDYKKGCLGHEHEEAQK